VHHGVKIQDNALVRQPPFRIDTLPTIPADKAIDLIDEAASRLRIEIDSLPTEIDEVERRITNMRSNERPQKERDAASKERL